MMRSSSALRILAFTALLVNAAAAETIAATTYQAMQWRLIGPFAGGRVTTVAGHAATPDIFYMGATGGGVWRTTDAGQTWRNISDGFFTANSIGAIAIAPSDPKFLVVGTGESPIRGVAAASGDGVYKSTDGGKSWSKIGLEHSRQISRIVIHPGNPDIVIVAAQGDPWGPSDERGIYRSEDGGKSWTRTLFVDKSTGACDLSIDAHDPNILYAATWDHQRFPWAVRSGGPGSGLWKSTDGGKNWTRLSEGLPALMGKIGVSVSPADSNRVYAAIEATEGGVFRSDDAGKSWKLVNSDEGPRDRGWYYSHITADPKNRDRVYEMAAPFLVSNDGGVTFTGIANPHGDNHGLWINPDNTDWMIEANDGGAIISRNGGKSWSSESNQPTGQFYRIETDALTPYNIYSAQQDRTSVKIASRTTHGGIGEMDWRPAGGGESSYFAVNRKDPRLAYASAGLGAVTEYDSVTETTRKLDPNPMFAGFRPASELKYRPNWNAPIRVSQQHPNEIYWGAQKVLRSTDRGVSWSEISPDLTRARPETMGTTGYPIQIEGAGGEHYATLADLVISPHDDKVIWTGSDDGMVHLTRDGGKSWRDVTPKGLPEGLVNAIEVSPRDPGTAYIAFTRYKLDDDAPYAFKTTDYGQSWISIAANLPAGHFVQVVREDPKRAGLLYAGTNNGAYVSFDDGKNWQPLQLNLPVVPVNDLQVHADDLVAATQGRGIWVIDGLAPLREITAQVAAEAVHLFAPEPALRWEGGGRPEENEGSNPPGGAVFYYSLANEAQEATLDILGPDGKPVQHFTSKPLAAGAGQQNVKGVMAQPPSPPLPLKAGMNRYVWDLRREAFTPVADTIRFVSFRPPRIGPGTYKARLTVDGKTSERDLQVLPHPGTMKATPEQWAEQQAMSVALYRMVNEDHDLTNALRAAKSKLTDQSLIGRIEAWEKQVPQSPLPNGVVDKISFPSGLLTTQILDTLSIADGPPPLSAGLKSRTAELAAQWAGLKSAGEKLLDQARGHP